MALTKVDGAGVGTLDSLTTSGTTSLDGSVIINESGASVDFRVEGDTDANALVVDASGDRVGIGVAAPASKLEITAGGNSHGLLRLDESDASNLSGYMQFDSNGTNKANVQNANNAGIHLCVGTGGTVTFTNLGYTAANALDDYEEGTWTAQITGSSSNPSSDVTLTSQYTKVGNLVYVCGQFSDVNTSGISGGIRITGLPFSPNPGNQATGNVMLHGIATWGGDNTANITPYFTGSYIAFYGNQNNAAWFELSAVAGTGKYISFSGVYKT